VDADKTASSIPSCFASKQEAHRCIALEAFSIARVCSCKCHSDWLVQTAVEAADAEEHETKGLGTDVLVLGTSGSSGIFLLFILWFSFSERFLSFLRNLLLEPIIFH
jgi:hypothetical protein